MKTILLADDHAFLRSGVEAVLRDTEFQIIATASRGDDALSLVRRLNPDICIFDYRMPGKTGLECLIAMRARGDSRPVVLLTAELQDRVLIDCIRSGVDAIVLKDGAEATLIEALTNVSSGQRYIPDALMRRAMLSSMSRQSDSPIDKLTPREIQFAKEVMKGARNRRIAENLGTSEGTVKVYLSSIFHKLGVTNRIEMTILLRPYVED